MTTNSNSIRFYEDKPFALRYANEAINEAKDKTQNEIIAEIENEKAWLKRAEEILKKELQIDTLEGETFIAAVERQGRRGTVALIMRNIPMFQAKIDALTKLLK